MLPGRVNELNQLNKYFGQNESSLLVLYGQSSVGISSLLEEFKEGKNTFEYCSKHCSEREQRYLWTGELRNQGIVCDNDYPDFSFIFERIISDSKDGKKLIIIRDFHRIVRVCPEFMTSLSAFVRAYKNDNRLMCILVSDHLGWIENAFVDIIGKNAFAITGFMKIKPLHFLELVCHYDTPDTAKCMDFYCILGGNPEYWDYFDISLSLRENIINVLLRDDGAFRNIGTDILKKELRETGVYATILATIAEGREKLNDIFVHTGFSRAKISVYLKNLMNLELVEKVYSYDTAGSENTKKGIYRISSPLVDFWFRFIYPNESLIKRMGAEEFYDSFIDGSLNKCIGKYFGSVCREYIDILNDRNLLPFKYTKKGEWVGKTGTINIVAQNTDRDTLLGFCNVDKPITTFFDYEWYCYTAKEARLRPDVMYLFSKGGFDRELTELAEKDDKIKLIDMREF